MSNTEWDEIQQNIGSSINDITILLALMEQTFQQNEEYRDSLISDLKERYEKGRENHKQSGTTWEEWTPEDFVLNISEEILDAIIYGAAFINKHESTVTITNAGEDES